MIDFRGLSDNARGAMLMMASMAAFTFNDLCVKAIGTDVPLSQLLLLRGILATALIYLLARSLNALVWPAQAKDRWLIVLRSLAEVSAAYFFLTALAARRLSAQVPSLTVTLIGSSFVMLAGGGASAVSGEWAALNAAQSALLVASALFVIGGYVFSVMVMRVGEVGFVAPFRYTAMVWALILGWLFFGEWPDALTFLGAGIIAVTGIFTLYREARAARGRHRA